jgi:hypothetical protein
MSGRCTGFSLKFDKHCESFPNGGPRIMMIINCVKEVQQGCALCEVHEKRKNEEKKSANYCQRFHGYKTEPIPDDLKVYGSKWFWDNVKKYGQPSEEFMAKAKKAHESVWVQAQEKPKVSESAPEKLVAKPKKSVESAEPPVKKQSTKRRTKQTLQVSEGVEQRKVIPNAIESMDTLKEIEVVRITVKRFQHNDTTYFRDASKNKLYAVGKDTKPSHYIGRWNPDTETIDTEYPDSDAE